jgi:transcription termination factor Rho
MAVLERSELEASPLADLHSIADQIGLEGFRRLRKAELIDAILGESPSAGAAAPDDDDGAGDDGDRDGASDAESGGARGEPREGRGGRLRRRRSRRAPAGDADTDDGDSGANDADDADAGDRADEPDESGGEERAPRARSGREAEGVVEVLGNGSAFLRVDPPEPSDDDVYISAAQVRRCELVSGDRVSGPVRTARRSERYPSLVRVDTINGQPADAVSDGVRYDDLPVAWPQERIALSSEDPTLAAIEWLTPLGLGSRAVIVGARGAGKTETLRRLLAALAGREELALSLVLAGARPEEIAEWGEGGTAPATALSFATSPDAQAQAVERAVDAAKRVASRGGNAVVLIDSLGSLPPHAARKTLAAARNLREGGSLTVIATAAEPLGGETTVIALDADLTSTGRQPILDLLASSTLRAELLVGEDGAEAIAKARASALEDR